MSQSYLDIPFHSSQSEESEESLSDNTEYRTQKRTRVKPQGKLNDEKSKKTQNTQTKVSPKTHKEKEGPSQKSTKSKTTKKKTTETKVKARTHKKVDISALTSRSTIKAVPKGLEADFNKGLPKSCWKKVIYPKVPPLKKKNILPSGQITKHPKRKLTKESNGDTMSIKKIAKTQATQRSSNLSNPATQHRVDALISAVSDMCKLVIRN